MSFMESNMKANKCLLLKTPDQRCFFTDEKNYPTLIEFGKTFGAEISIVNTKELVEIQDLSDLAKSICSETKIEYPAYEVVETKLPAVVNPTTENRNSKLKQAKEVIDFIRAELLAGNLVSLSMLETRFTNISKSSLSNYFSRAKRELLSQGHDVKREKPGQWIIKKKTIYWQD
jgi:hypothetical protein